MSNTEQRKTASYKLIGADKLTVKTPNGQHLTYDCLLDLPEDVVALARKGTAYGNQIVLLRVRLSDGEQEIRREMTPGELLHAVSVVYLLDS